MTAALLFSIVVAFQAAAHAQRRGQRPPPEPAAQTDDQEARSLFEAGETAYHAGRFERALEYFQRAYELSARPGLLFNIANASDRLHRGREALEAYRRFVELDPESPNAPFAAARAQSLEAELAGAGGGGEAATAAPAASAGPSVPGLVMLVAGGVVALSSIGTTLWWVDRLGATDVCASMGGCANAGELAGQRDLAGGLTIGLAAAGVTAVVIGLALLLTDGGGAPAATALRCAPGLGGLSCEGTF